VAQVWATAAAVLFGLTPALAQPSGAQAATARAKSAQSGPSVDDQLRAARQQVADASADESRLVAQIQASADRKKGLDAATAVLQSQVAAAQGAKADAEARVIALTDQALDSERRLADTVAALGVARAELGRQALAAYTGQTEAVRYLEAALRARDMTELVAKREYMKAVIGSQTEAIAVHERLRNEVKQLRDRLATSRAGVQAERDRVAAEQIRLQSQTDAQASTAAQAAAEVDRGTKLRDEAVARKAEFQGEVDDLQRESASVAATLRQRQSSAASAPASGSAAPSKSGPASKGASRPQGAAPAPAPSKRPSQLSAPIPGASVISPFGMRLHPIYGDLRMHTGVDFAASEGTAIHAAADGVVVSAGPMGGYGNATVIDHGGGLATLYAHQSAILVSPGERVTRGQVIGRVGCTGACTGPHLHFEVRVDGDPVDPMGYR
jgi:murein DD-endopeptidase MepM/ murein hydrolase activator NlpD